MGKLYKTFDEFDAIESSLEKYSTTNRIWYPSEEYDRELVNHMDRYLPYLIWLTEFTTPQTEYDKSEQKRLQRLLNDNLELVDNPEEIPKEIPEDEPEEIEIDINRRTISC